MTRDEKIALGFAAILIAVMLAILYSALQGQTTNTKSERLFIFVDSNTGCQYLSTTIDGAIFPRIGSDGRQICVPPGKATGV